MNFISILISLICVIFIAFCLYYVIKNIKTNYREKDAENAVIAAVIAIRKIK